MNHLDYINLDVCMCSPLLPISRNSKRRVAKVPMRLEYTSQTLRTMTELQALTFWGMWGFYNVRSATSELTRGGNGKSGISGIMVSWIDQDWKGSHNFFAFFLPKRIEAYGTGIKSTQTLSCALEENFFSETHHRIVSWTGIIHAQQSKRQDAVSTPWTCSVLFLHYAWQPSPYSTTKWI